MGAPRYKAPGRPRPIGYPHLSAIGLEAWVEYCECGQRFRANYTNLTVMWHLIENVDLPFLHPDIVRLVRDDNGKRRIRRERLGPRVFGEKLYVFLDDKFNDSLAGMLGQGSGLAVVQSPGKCCTNCRDGEDVAFGTCCTITFGDGTPFMDGACMECIRQGKAPTCSLVKHGLPDDTRGMDPTALVAQFMSEYRELVFDMVLGASNDGEKGVTDTG